MTQPLRPFRKNSLALAVIMALGVGPTQDALGASCSWLPGTGNWAGAGNWSCGVVPTGAAQDSATIAIGKTVTVNTGQSIYTLDNAGSIDIDAFLLSLASGGSTTNSGTINVGTASVTGALQVFNNIDNTGGTINIANGSVVNQFGTGITGGAINGAGTLTPINSGNNFLTGVTLGATLDLATATGVERVTGGLTLNGAINVNANSVLNFEGTQTLGGTGTITLGNTGSSNRIGIDGSATLSVGSGILIHGQNGTIGGQPFVGGAGQLANAGTLSADVGGGSLNLVIQQTNNTGTLSAANGGQLVLSGAVTNTGGGHIDATGAGSNVYQNAVTITGGAINTSNGGVFIASNNGNNILSGATLNGTLDLASATGSERIVNGLTLTSGSHVNVNANSVLSFEGIQTLGGSGSITLGDTGSSNRIAIDNTGTLTVGSGVLIHGQNGTIGGQIYVAGASSLINNGTIAADVAGGRIDIATTSGATNSVTNNGLLEAINGGTLYLDSNVTGASGSSISVGAGSTVVQNGVTLSGTIGTTGSGDFIATNNGNNFLNGVAFTGTLDLANTASERVINGLTLNGAAHLNANSVLSFEGSQTLSGAGTITLGDTGSSNRIAIDDTGTLTVGSGILIHGQNGTIGGQIYVGGASTLVNNGTIAADVAGGRIDIATTSGATNSVTNNGLLEAINGGTLYLDSNVTGTSGSSISIGAGSTVVQNGVTLSSVINNAGTGNFIASNNGNNFFNGVAFTGTLDMATNTASERVVNGLVLNGAVNLNANSVLSFEGSQTLSGNGTITLGSTGSSNRLSIDNSATLTVGSNILIHGQNGTIGSQVYIGGASTLDNGGTISADVATGSLNLVAGQTNNTGTLSAANGGQLVLSGPITNTGSGHLSATGAGSNLYQNGVTINGGAIDTSGGGVLIASNNGSNTLSGVTLNGTLDIASATGSERIVGGLALNGAINVNANSVLVFQDAQSLTGTGTITLGSTGSSNRLAIDNAGVLDVGSNIIIQGQNGTIGAPVYIGGASTLNNGGVITANVGGGSISLAANQTNNTGTLSATNGGQLVLEGTVSNNGGGHIDAIGTGSNVYQKGITVAGGTINTSGGGVFIASNNGSNTLSGVTLDGRLDLASSTGFENVNSGLTLVAGSTVGLNANSVLNFNGDQTLAGTGTVTLGDTGSSNRITIDGTSTLTVASGVTINGQNGTIGGQYFTGGANTLVNNGTISASVPGGTIAIAAANVVNNGTLATQGGTLNVSSSVTGTGALSVGNGGTINLANGGNTQGTLAVGNTGTINIGTGNLTINTDYTNAQAGSGNAFNRTAGITGSGSVVAGGNAAQAITGATVTGGNTANATLTIGNVHVGTTTVDYQVANTGTSGPSLRGAIQTNVNGANLTDARLSGSGVTASNYDTGAPGSHSGNLAVNFTASNAGALTPLNGQVLNLTSNFANIGDQKLAIVLGNGAAAYNLAGGTTASPVQVSNQRVGGTATNAISITNTAAAGSYSEDLTAFVTAHNGSTIASGSVTGLTAGNGSSAIAVGVDTGTAGAKTGTVVIGYQSAGTVAGVSNGLGTTNVGTQTVTVSGNVYQAAAGALQTAPLNFGVVQVGQSVSQNLVVRNTATGGSGYVEDLNAGFGASTGTSASLITGSGSLSGILAGANSTASNGAMTVTINTASAGNVSGGITVNYATAGAVHGVGNGLGSAAVGSENYGVSGTIQATVINHADPVIANSSIDLGARRVGDAAATASVSVTNQASGGQQAALNATIASNGAPATATGNFNLLAPGATSNNLSVGLSTATAGNFTGANAKSATVSFVSDASNVGNCGSNCQLDLPSQQVTVSGKVYTVAGAQVNTPAIDFGVVHTGDVVSRNVSVANSALSSGLNDTLSGSIGGATGAFSASGSFSGLAAQASDAGSLTVGLDTTHSGVFNGGATATFASHDADLADAALGTRGVTLTGTVDNYAVATLTGFSGAASVSHTGSTYTLDFGNLLQGSAGLVDTFDVANGALGLADLLAGSFDVSGGTPGFDLGGFAAFAGLGAGQEQSGFSVTLDGSTAGSFSDTLVLHSTGSNANYQGAVDDVTLVLRGHVIGGVSAVPEPGNLSLMFAGLGALLGLARFKRKSRARAAA